MIVAGKGRSSESSMRRSLHHCQCPSVEEQLHSSEVAILPWEASVSHLPSLLPCHRQPLPGSKSATLSPQGSRCAPFQVCYPVTCAPRSMSATLSPPAFARPFQVCYPVTASLGDVP